MATGLAGRVAAIVLGFMGIAAPSVGAAPAEPPTCQGRDLLAEARTSDPEGYQRIREAAALVPNGEAMLWRIERAGVAPSHLLGTIHVSDPRVTKLPARTRQVLQQAGHLAVEVADISPAAFGRAMGRLRDRVVFVDGRSLAGLLDAEEHKVAEAASRRAGLPAELFAVARPWLVTVMLAVSDCERERLKAGKLALDLTLVEAAKERSIPVTGLETMEDQLAAMAAVPESDQLLVLRANLKLRDHTQDAHETILQRYLAREINAVWPMQEENWRRAGFDVAALGAFKRELITVRNVRMRDAALPLLAKGNALIAVGALHLVGEDGLVALLRAAGFSVVPVE